MNKQELMDEVKAHIKNYAQANPSITAEQFAEGVVEYFEALEEREFLEVDDLPPVNDTHCKCGERIGDYGCPRCGE